MNTDELIARLRTKNENGSLVEITEDGQSQAADALEALQAKLTQLEKQEPIGCGYIAKWESGDTPSTYETGYVQVLGVDVYALPKALDIGGQPT